MLKYLCKRMKIPEEKMVIVLDEFGNTSSASIPLAIAARLARRLLNEPLRIVLAGFGVGWSWGAAAIVCGPMIIPNIVYVDDSPEPGNHLS
jgi:3-oxoacyl-[acyl-carrier-protein] synthase-3